MIGNRDQKWSKVKHHEKVVGLQEDVCFLASEELFRLFLYIRVTDVYLTIEII